MLLLLHNLTRKQRKKPRQVRLHQSHETAIIPRYDTQPAGIVVPQERRELGAGQWVLQQQHRHQSGGVRTAGTPERPPRTDTPADGLHHVVQFGYAQPQLGGVAPDESPHLRQQPAQG